MRSEDSIQWPWLLALVSIDILLFASPVIGGLACLSNPCVHGVCLDDLNTSYSCYCIDGYTGIQCQTNWDECWSNPCQNGGVCHDGIASFNCSCPEGFVGDFCEENFNECQSNPCQNNGTCKDGANGYACNCLPGYSGVHCEIDVAVCDVTNETRCANGGICQEGPGATFTCKCSPGWTGFLCDVEIDECLSAPCQNGAICIDMHADYACACLFGFTGQNCEEVIMVCEDNPCQNSALCLMETEHPTCYCVPDYHGDKCQYQYDECQLGPRCMNGGTCIDGVDTFSCSCPPSLTGVLCECLVLGNNKYDCSYVSPTVSTNGSTTTGLTTKPSTTIEGRWFSTTERTTILPTTFITTQETTSVMTTTEQISSSTTTEMTSTATTKETVPNLTTLPIESTTFYANTTIPTTIFTEAITTVDIEVDTTTLASTTLLPTTTTLLSSTDDNVYSTIFSSTKPPDMYSTEVDAITTVADTTVTVTSTTINDNFTTVISTQRVLTTTPMLIDTSTVEELFSSTKLPTDYTTTPVISTKPTEYTTYTTENQLDTETTVVDVLNNFTTTTIGVYSTKTTETDAFSQRSLDDRTTEYITDRTSEFFTLSSVPWLRTTEALLTHSPTTILERNFTTTSEISTTPIPLTTFITTTEVSTSTIFYPDCTLSQNHCLNGGTCMSTSEGNRCVCPFDADGPLCETHLGIRNAAFGGDSYLTHRLTDKTSMLVEFRAKTLSMSGTIFYANMDTTYMTLYVENGYLKFKFSCGFQTMLLSELKRPVNNGYLMNIKAELKFSKDVNHCYATINLNNTLSMSGDQIALMNKFSKHNSWLYLGGIPQENVKDFLPVHGFVGCMNELKISGRNINIFKDAEDGFEISECSSLACLSNPCENGATCTGHADNWYCICKNGFSGRTCEISVCQNNPCQYGGTCISFTGSGYICLCPFGKHGHFCENDMVISELQFSSSIHGLSSFVAYPIPEGIANKMEIKFRFSTTTFDQIAILLFIGQRGQHDAHSDHIAISFVKGYIMLTWNLGSGPRRIFTTKPIERGTANHLVQVGRTGRRAWLHVETLGNVTGRSPGSLVNLDVVPVIYIGGHESQNFSSLPHDLPLHSGFSGCIYDVEVKSGSIVIPLHNSKHAIGRALGQCGTTECYDKICRNGGACLYHGGTFTCLCQEGWYGPLCSSKYNPCDTFKHNCSLGSTCVPLMSDYECDCQLGKAGKFCEIEEKLSDVSFTGTRSFLKLDPFGFDSSQFSIDLEIRPLRDRGLILFAGHKEISYLSLSIQSSLLELRIVPGTRKRTTTDIITIRSNKLLGKGVWHKIRIGKYGRKLYLFVDNVVNTGLLQTGDNLNIGDENIYLGGLSDMSLLPTDAMSILPTPYKGCIRQFTINFKHIPLTFSNIKQSRNVGDCDGTPCGGEYCLNNGVCWLDPHLKPHCTCQEPYYGEKCQLVPSCATEPCRNKGRCVNSKCSCTVGYNGAFCEATLVVKMPKFQGKSYLIVDKALDKKRGVNFDDTKSFYLNFTTANKEGLLLWTNKGKNFLGLGLERGYLKLVYSSSASNKHIELPDLGQISDGLWHYLEVTTDPVMVKFDNEIIYVQKSYEGHTNGLSNGTFYLGGIKSSSPISKEVTAIFHNGFDGCIDTFITDSKNIINDFTKYEGENIGTCNLV